MNEKIPSIGNILKAIGFIVGAIIAGYSWAADISNHPPLVNSKVGVLLGVAVCIGIVLWHFLSQQSLIHKLSTIPIAKITVREIIQGPGPYACLVIKNIESPYFRRNLL
jgi:uncharacterized protein YneF (UPF0154 family)